MNIIKKVLTSGNFFASKDLPLLEQLATFLFIKKLKKRKSFYEKDKLMTRYIMFKKDYCGFISFMKEKKLIRGL